jgi:hypothetical protein
MAWTAKDKVILYPKMNPPNSSHLNEVLQEHYQFDGDYCAVSALEFASKIYGLTPLEKFPLQCDPQNQSKGFDEQALQNRVSLKGNSMHCDIQSAVETIEKETNEGRCVSVSLRAFLTLGPFLIPSGYHILVALSRDGQPTLIDPQTKQATVQGTVDLAKVLQQNSDLNPSRKTIHMEILYPR